jgi:ribosomal protein S27E
VSGTAGHDKEEEGAMNMKVNCLSCGHKVELGYAYDDYTGPIKCNACHTLLYIKTEEASLRSVAYLPESAAFAPAGEVVHRRSHSSHATPQE